MHPGFDNWKVKGQNPFGLQSISKIESVVNILEMLKSV